MHVVLADMYTEIRKYLISLRKDVCIEKEVREFTSNSTLFFKICLMKRNSKGSFIN